MLKHDFIEVLKKVSPCYSVVHDVKYISYSALQLLFETFFDVININEVAIKIMPFLTSSSR
jgi:hypothetical protein